MTISQIINNKSFFILEIGTEDLPARFLPLAIRQLGENTKTILTENQIQFSKIKTYGTPRRLVVIGEGVPRMQDDRIKEVYGPSRKVAYDENGNPTKAAIGFANSHGINVENLVVKKKDKGEYIVAIIEEKGKEIQKILPEVFKRIVLSIHLPKSMRWGDGNIRFARPIRWLMAFLNDEIINFEIDGIKSGNLTRGHRFLSPAAFQIKEISTYKKLLANNYVIVDPEERKRIIIDKMDKILSSLDKKAVEDEELLETVINLVEYPVPVLATFPEKYLDLPKELLITVMKGHQKYFAVQGKDGMLSNYFVVISNTTKENSDTVKTGAERVIRARFEDAKFYYEEDSKKSLADRINDLRKVTFNERLGTLYEKTERIVNVAEFLADRILSSSKDILLRAAWLAKTDLLTGVVREFPELQGVMGKYYALKNGETKEVANALEEQYLPAHSGGKLPESDIGSLLSISDKIDNIAGFFSIGLTPTGSEDPFALRRQALAILSIILHRRIEITLKELVNKALEPFHHLQVTEDVPIVILKFFKNRLENILLEQGYNTDIVQSALSLSADIYLNQLKKRIDSLKRFKEKSEYNDFLTAIKRISNILPKKVTLPSFNKVLLKEESEKMLAQKLDSITSILKGSLDLQDYDSAINILTSLTNYINSFFDNVLVMDKDDNIRLNRLSLLNEVWKKASEVTDFSKLL